MQADEKNPPVNFFIKGLRLLTKSSYSDKIILAKENSTSLKALREKAFFTGIFRESAVCCESDKFRNKLPLPSVCRNKACRMTALKSQECRLTTEYGWNRGVIISLHPIQKNCFGMKRFLFIKSERKKLND